MSGGTSGSGGIGEFAIGVGAIGVSGTPPVSPTPDPPGPANMPGIQAENGGNVLSEAGVPFAIQPEDVPAGPPQPPGPPTFHYFPPPPTRMLSWLQMCMEADPDYRRLSLRPWIYEFSNGRLFVESIPVYGQTAITDDFGTAITDDFGTQIQSDGGDSGVAPPSSGEGGTGFPFGEGAFGQTGF